MLGEGETKNSVELVNKLVKENLGLVGYIINRHYETYVNGYYGRQDMFQDGAIGMMRAAEKWEPAKGKFTTYAYMYVKQYIAEGLREKGFKVVRIPNYLYDLRNAKTTQDRKEKEERRTKPRPEKLKASDVTEEDVPEELRINGEKVGLIAQQGLELLDRINSAVVHLDEDTPDGPVRDVLPDPIDGLLELIDKEAYDFLVACVKTELKRICARFKHPKRDYNLFLDRFGMNEEERWYSYQALAGKYGLGSAMAANLICDKIVTRLRKCVTAMPKKFQKRARIRGDHNED